MSHKLSRAPLAITSEGEMLLNVFQFDITGKTIDRLVAQAKDERGAVFIGIVVSPTEAEQVRRDLDDTSLQASFVVVAARQSRARRRSKRR
jgi:orotidine-5'-phosphate decarboxylase